MGNTESSPRVDLVVSEDRKWFSLDKVHFYRTKRILSISIEADDDPEDKEKNSSLIITVSSVNGIDRNCLQTNMMTNEEAQRTFRLFTGPLLSEKDAKSLTKENSTEEKETLQ